MERHTHYGGFANGRVAVGELAQAKHATAETEAEVEALRTRMASSEQQQSTGAATVTQLTGQVGRLEAQLKKGAHQLAEAEVEASAAAAREEQVMSAYGFRNPMCWVWFLARRSESSAWPWKHCAEIEIQQPRLFSFTGATKWGC